MEKNKMKFAIRAAFAAAFAVVLAGCSEDAKGPDAPETVEQDPVKRRMNDPAYVAKIEKHIERRREIMAELDALKKRLDEAKASGAAAEALEALEKKIKEGLKAIEQNSKSAVAQVRERMLADTERPVSGAKKN